MLDAPRLLARANQLTDQAYDAFKGGDADRSRELNLESLEVARRIDDPQAIVRALAGMMRLALREHDNDAVERLAAECDELASEAVDQSLRRLPLHMRAEAARMKGDSTTARELFDASIALNRELGNEGMVTVELANRSWVEINEGLLDEAEKLLRTSLARTDDDDRYGLASCLLGLARVQLERGDAGAEILGAADSQLEQDALVWDPAEQREYERTLALAREVAGERLGQLRELGRTRDPRAF